MPQTQSFKFQVSLAFPPPWLPPAVKTRLLESKSPITYTARLTQSECKVLRKPKPILPSKWAERHRVLTMSALPGQWRNIITPYLVGIMDAADFSSVETIIMCKAPQTGGSEVVNNYVGYSIDRKPGPPLYVFPDEKTARENSQDRIIPMITSSPRLSSFLTGVDDDMATLRIRLRHMPIYLAWARSAASLANKPIRYLVFDEVDKYPDTAGKREADPISLGEKRAITYTGKRKIFKVSTPTIEAGNIWQALTKEAQVVFDFWVECPHCNELQLMAFDQIKFPENERDPEKIIAEKLAEYKCGHCGARWDDEARNSAVRKGKWFARLKREIADPEEHGLELFKYLRKHRPLKIGFHIPSWLSYFVSLSEVAAAFLRGLTNKQKLKDFKNNHEAVPWLDYSVERTEDAILKLCDDRPRGLVPGGNIIAGLTAAADTHKSEFVYEIRAWGWGLEQDSWCIREGVAPTLKALEQIFWEDVYLDMDDNRYIIHMAVIDAMGAGRTAEVYAWCTQHRGRVLPLKGEQRMNQPFSYTKIERYPGTNKQIPGGIQLLRINRTFYNNDLSNKLEIVGGDPGSWRYHSEISRQWALEMTAEYLDEKGIWQCPEGKANHAWDVAAYSLAAADVIGLKHWQKRERDPEPAKTKKPQSKDRRENIRDFERPGWLNR